MAPFTEEGRLRVEGPGVRLTPVAAQAIGMALHELATNASKYGAWSNDLGRVNVAWTRDTETLQLRWTETRGPPVQEPSTSGVWLNGYVDVG